MTAQTLVTAPKTAAEETHTGWLLTVHARSGRTAKPPSPMAAQDGLSSASLLFFLIALVAIRVRRRRDAHAAAVGADAEIHAGQRFAQRGTHIGGEIANAGPARRRARGDGALPVAGPPRLHIRRTCKKKLLGMIMKYN